MNEYNNLFLNLINLLTPGDSSQTVGLEAKKDPSKIFALPNPNIFIILYVIDR